MLGVTLWRVSVAVVLASAALRVGGLGFLLPGLVWYALQFGPLLVFGVAQAIGLLRARRPLPRSAVAVFWGCAGLLVVTSISATGSTEPLQTLSQVGILALVLLFLFTSYAGRWRDADVLDGDLRTVFCVGAALEGLGVVGFLSNQAWAIGEYGRMVGTTTNANFVGIGSAVLVALAFHFREFWTKIAALVPLTALFLSDSRGSLLALVAGLITMLIASPSARRSRADWIPAVAVIVVTPTLFLFRSMNLLAGLTGRFAPVLPGMPGGPGGPGGPAGPGPEMPDLTSGRLEIYRAYLAQWVHQPWLGSGYRTTQVWISGQLFEAHNIYLSVLVETGVLGALAFLAFLVFMFRSAARQVRLIGAAVTVLVADLTASTLFGFGNATSIMGWIVLFAWASTGIANADPADVGHGPVPVEN